MAIDIFIILIILTIIVLAISIAVAAYSRWLFEAAEAVEAANRRFDQRFQNRLDRLRH